MKQSIIIVCILAAVSFAGLDSPENPRVLQGLGLAAGYYSGVGMSYKLVLDSRYAAQLTVGYYSDNDWGDRWAMPGIELQYHLSRNKYTSFYLSTGLSYEYYRSEYVYWDYIDDTTWNYNTTHETDETWTTGFGFGFEILVFDRISATIESIIYYRDTGQASIMVQGGLHYYFNMPNRD